MTVMVCYPQSLPRHSFSLGGEHIALSILFIANHDYISLKLQSSKAKKKKKILPSKFNPNIHIAMIYKLFLVQDINWITNQVWGSSHSQQRGPSSVFSCIWHQLSIVSVEKTGIKRRTRSQLSNNKFLDISIVLFITIKLMGKCTILSTNKNNVLIV